MEHQAESDEASPVLPFLGLPHHHAYTVTDLARAVAHWHQVTGIGPFIVVPHVQFDSLAMCGTPITLDHTAAFAALGEQSFELQVIHEISPQASAAYGADAAGTALHHIAFAVDDPDAGRSRARPVPCRASRQVSCPSHAAGIASNIHAHQPGERSVTAIRVTSQPERP